MNSFQNSPSLTYHNASVIVRLRGPDGIINKLSENQNKINSKSPSQKKTFQRLNSRIKTTKTPEKNKSQSNGLDSDSKYTMFTSKNPSNLLIVSNKPITGKI